MDRRLLSFLGLARRAGKLCLGRDAAEESIRAAKAEALLLASDISERSARQIRRDAAEHGVPVLCLAAGMSQIEAAVGKRAGILTVTDAGFAGRLMALAKAPGAGAEEAGIPNQGEEHAV